MEKKLEFHGSDLEAVSAHYGIPKEEITCYSANVNPLGLSQTLKTELASHLDILSAYPDRDYTELREVISRYCHVSPDYVAVGNGVTELISLLIQSRRPEKALLLGPTYSEYERELRLVGCSLDYYNLPEENDFRLNAEDLGCILTQSYDLLIVCNPNNPTSSALNTETLSHILRMCKENNCFLMIDETYVEFAPDMDAITAMPLTSRYDNLMVLRGVSKFFAAPGLRLGYGVTSDLTFLSHLKQVQNPWSLNSIGAFAGVHMLQDTDYIQKTRDLIGNEQNRILSFLSKLPHIKFYPVHSNFILIRLLKPGLTASAVFEKLILQGMMIRDCTSFHQLEGEYIRFCIQAPDDNTRLLHALEKILV